MKKILYIIFLFLLCSSSLMTVDAQSHSTRAYVPPPKDGDDGKIDEDPVYNYDRFPTTITLGTISSNKRFDRIVGIAEAPLGPSPSIITFSIDEDFCYLSFALQGKYNYDFVVKDIKNNKVVINTKFTYNGTKSIYSYASPDPLPRGNYEATLSMVPTSIILAGSPPKQLIYFQPSFNISKPVNYNNRTSEISDISNYNWSTSLAYPITNTCQSLYAAKIGIYPDKKLYDLSYCSFDKKYYYINTSVTINETSDILCNITGNGVICNNIFIHNAENPNLGSSKSNLEYNFQKVEPGTYNVVYVVSIAKDIDVFNICTNIKPHEEPKPIDPVDPIDPIDPIEPIDPVDPIDPRPSALVVSYTYNIRSWTKSIISPLFKQELFYNESDGANTPSYNGNISRIKWEHEEKGKKKGEKSYNFGYDALSQLKSADYSEQGKYGANYSYDKHGNMLTLERMGKISATDYGTIDELTMSYNGNQLVNVKDGGENVIIAESSDFKDYTKGKGAYEYNANGAMTKDTHKGISNIEYNSLNLPMEMDILSPIAEARNEYLYTATGAKLQVKKRWNPDYSETPLMGGTVDESALTITQTTDYVGNKIYDNGELIKILVDGGYYDLRAEKYYFYIQDHLGNNRVVADTAGTVIQQSDYYPFGMEFADNTHQDEQPYKYNGKELDKESGLNLYDYSARYMEPAIGRFTSVDPLAEKYYSWSPYAYVGNNPMRRIDPTGMDTDDIIITGTDNNQLRIEHTGPDININIPFPLGGSRTEDIGLSNTPLGRLAVGYTTQVDLSLALGFGFSGGGEVSVVQFLDDNYGGYNYVYAGLHETVSFGVQVDASVTAGVSLFIAYDTAERPINPITFAGHTGSIGISFDAKDGIGAGANINVFSSSGMDPGWKGVSVGVNGGLGVSGVTGALGWGQSKTWLLNDIKPTRERTFMDKVSNSIAPISSSVIKKM